MAAASSTPSSDTPLDRLPDEASEHDPRANASAGRNGAYQGSLTRHDTEGLQKEIEALKEELERSRKRVEELERENMELRRRSSNDSEIGNQGFSLLGKTYSQLEKERERCADLEKTNEKLKSKLQDMTAQMTEEKTKNVQLEKTIKDLLKTLQEKDAEIKHLCERLHKVEIALEAREDGMKEMQEERKEVKKQLLELRRLSLSTAQEAESAKRTAERAESVANAAASATKSTTNGAAAVASALPLQDIASPGDFRRNFASPTTRSPVNNKTSGISSTMIEEQEDASKSNT